MTSKPVVLPVSITELRTLVEQKSIQTALNNKSEPMSLPINNISFWCTHVHFLYPRNQQCAIIYAFLCLAYLRLFHWPYCLIWIMILSFPPQNPKSSLAVWDCRSTLPRLENLWLSIWNLTSSCKQISKH